LLLLYLNRLKKAVTSSAMVEKHLRMLPILITASKYYSLL
jgi:hypothetical protein